MPAKPERFCTQCGRGCKYSMCRDCERRLTREATGFGRIGFDDFTVRSVGYDGRLQGD